MRVLVDVVDEEGADLLAGELAAFESVGRERIHQGVQVQAPRARPPPAPPARRSAGPGGPAATFEMFRSVGAGSLRAVFLEFVEQRLLADAQDLGGAGLVVPGVLERQLDQRALGLFDGVADGNAQLAAGRARRRGTGSAAEAGRQMRRIDASLRPPESPRAPARCAARARCRARSELAAAPSRRPTRRSPWCRACDSDPPAAPRPAPADPPGARAAAAAESETRSGGRTDPRGTSLP